jgi:hypothetical protein
LRCKYDVVGREITGTALRNDAPFFYSQFFQKTHRSIFAAIESRRRRVIKRGMHEIIKQLSPVNTHQPIQTLLLAVHVCIHLLTRTARHHSWAPGTASGVGRRRLPWAMAAGQVRFPLSFTAWLPEMRDRHTWARGGPAVGAQHRRCPC